MIESSGQGALSIWTHNLKGLEYQPSFEGSMYSGAAIKMGAGIQAYEAYEFAKEYNVTLVAGEGETVGVAGGYSKFCSQVGCLGSHSFLWIFLLRLLAKRSPSSASRPPRARYSY